MKLLVDKWLEDFPIQFVEKKNIEILVRAFAKQLQEIYDCMKDLNTKTSLDEAVGANLDRIGNILSLTRKQAHLILRTRADVDVDDDRYRAVLRYWSIRCNRDCTYEDIMDGLSQIWDTSDITYVEPPERPATILLTMPTLDLDSPDPREVRALAFKAGGVQLVYVLGYLWEIDDTLREKFDPWRMVIRFELCLYRELFWDGTWILDGKEDLSGYCYHIHMPFRMVIRLKSGKLLDGTWILDGTDLLDSVGKGFYDDEKITGVYITSKDEWFLDGKYLLDGSKMLDVSVIREEL